MSLHIDDKGILNPNFYSYRYQYQYSNLHQYLVVHTYVSIKIVEKRGNKSVVQSMYTTKLEGGSVKAGPLIVHHLELDRAFSDIFSIKRGLEHKIPLCGKAPIRGVNTALQSDSCNKVGDDG